MSTRSVLAMEVHHMNIRHLLLLFIFATLLRPTDIVWSGAPAGGVCFREIHLAHICQGPMNNGQSCTVSAPGCEPNASPDCPGGQCVVDYTTPTVVTADVTIMFDKETSTWESPQRSLGPALTALLCVNKNGKHCFTETYRLDPQSNCAIDTVWMGQAGCVEEQEVGVNISKSQLVNLFRYYVPEGLFNPDGDLAEGLRQLYGKTGVPVVTDFTTPAAANDHNGDNTGSVAKFTAKLRFVSAVLP